MATERAGAVRAAAKGRGAARRPGTDVEDAPPPPLLLRDAKAVGRRKRGGGGALRSSGRRRNADPGQTGADRWGRRGRRSLRHTVEPTQPRPTDAYGRRQRCPIPSTGASTAPFGARMSFGHEAGRVPAATDASSGTEGCPPEQAASAHRGVAKTDAKRPSPTLLVRGNRSASGDGRGHRVRARCRQKMRGAAAAAFPLTPHLLSVGATHRLAGSTEAGSSQLQPGSGNEASVMRWSEEARTEARAVPRPDPVPPGMIRRWKRRSRPPARAGTLRRAPEGARRGNHRRQDDASRR